MCVRIRTHPPRLFPRCLPLWAPSPSVSFVQATDTCLRSNPCTVALYTHPCASSGGSSLCSHPHWHRLDSRYCYSRGRSRKEPRSLKAAPGTAVALNPPEQATESPGGLIKPPPWLGPAPPPELLIFGSGGGARVFAFLVSYQVLLVLRVWGASLENHLADAEGVFQSPGGPGPPAGPQRRGGCPSVVSWGSQRHPPITLFSPVLLPASEGKPWVVSLSERRLAELSTCPGQADPM